MEAQLSDLRLELDHARKQRDDSQEVAQGLALDLEDARAELATERTLRISADAIAAERLGYVQRAYESAERAEQARDHAVSGQLKSLDMVNTSFMKAMAPEKTPNIKEFSSSMERLPAPPRTPRGKMADMETAKSTLEQYRKIRESRQLQSDQSIEDFFVESA